jgi:hypothetical protein
MNAQLLNIVTKKKSNPLVIASTDDFEFSEGNPVDAHALIQSPNVSLYCLDHPNQQAIFVETPHSVNLAQAPFYYQAQYENTTGLYGLAYDTLHQLANEIDIDSKRIIFIHSVGRSGSTLLSSVLNEVENIVGYSEPDVFTQLVQIRAWDGSNEAEVSELVKSCTKVFCKGTAQTPNPTTWVIKCRSFGIQNADFLYKHFPHSKNIFLYREAITWYASNMRAFIEGDQSPEVRAFWQMWFSPLVPSIAKYSVEKGEILSFPQMGMLMWLSILEAYSSLQQQGAPIIAARFQDLIAAPHQVITKILEFCEVRPSNLDEIFKVLEKDSQFGTIISRENVQQKEFTLTEAQKTEILQILQGHPVIQTPDFVVPATLFLDPS